MPCRLQFDNSVIFSSFLITVSKILVTTGHNQEGYQTTSEIVDLTVKGGYKCNIWEPFQIGVRGATGGVIGDTVIICGGYDGSNNVDECYRLSSEKNPQLITHMLVERQYAASIVLNDNILWVTGGWSGAYLASTEYVTSTGTILGPNLPQPLTNHAMIAINKTCSMVIGGISTDYSASTSFNGEQAEDQDRTFFYDHNEGEWITGPSLMQARLNHAAGIITDDVTDEPLVVVTGGRTGGRNYSDGWFYLNSTEILQDGEWVQGKIINTICIPGHGIGINS